MKLSQHEQQVLEEIQQGVRAEDPEFFARMAGSQSRRSRSVRGSVMFLSGLVAFMLAAIIAFNKHGQTAGLRRRAFRYWDSLKDPPPPGMSP